MELSSNLNRLREQRGWNKARVQAEAGGIHLFSMGKLDANKSSRIPLASVSRLCRVFGVGAAPSPGTSEPGYTHQWLWEWDTVAGGESMLRWNLAAICKERGITRAELYYATHISQSSLRGMLEGGYLQSGFESLEAICQALRVGLAPPPPGTTTDQWLFSWVDKRVIINAVEPAVYDGEVEFEGTKVCKGPLCSDTDPNGVAKGLHAFPKAERYSQGVGPVCNKCRSYAERARRVKRRAAAAAAKTAAGEKA
jgi:DNA-binding Xre family transcriptional regulator